MQKMPHFEPEEEMWLCQRLLTTQRREDSECVREREWVEDRERKRERDRDRERGRGRGR